MNAWKKQGLKPNAKVDDHTFVRRAYLDITGTIPTYEQTVRFIESEESTKRESLVPGLLLSDGYSSHLYNYFADLLRIQSKVPGTALRMDPFAEWLKTSLHENLPYDQLVKQMMTAQGTMRENPAAGYHLRDHGMKLDHVAYMSKAFLGTDIACAQCHDHPFEDWTQKDYYQFTAYLGEMNTIEYSKMHPQATKDKIAAAKAENKKTKTKSARTVLYKEVMDSIIRERGWDKQEKKKKLQQLTVGYLTRYRAIKQAYELKVSDAQGEHLTLPETYEYDDAKPGDVVIPKFLFSNEGGAGSTKGRTPRERLANWLASGDNEHFANTIANHMWSRFFGRGVAEPLYDINLGKPDMPELLDVLREEMVALDFDLAAFSWMLASTDAYQRTASRKLDKEGYYFPGPLLRRMSSEQVWDSFLTLMVEDPLRYRASDGTAYQRVIDIKDDLDGITGETLKKRVATYNAFKAEDQMRDSTRNQTIAESKGKTAKTETATQMADPMDEAMGGMMANQTFKAKGAKMILTRASELPQPMYNGHFLRKFGQSSRDFIVDAASRQGSVPQVMEMMNGAATERLCKSDSLLYKRMQNTEGTGQQASVLFLSVLNREPNAVELKALGNSLKDKKGKSRAIWALLNTPEFFFQK